MPQHTTPAQPSAADEYIFRTTDEELVRLGFQHRVWAAATYTGWERAGFGPGSRVIDLGAGPGYATIDLAHLVGPAGAVLAVDESSRFLGLLERRLAVEPISNVTTQHARADAFSATPGSFDAVYARWLMSFLPEPGVVARRVFEALRPGGSFIIQDYSNYKGAGLWPESSAFRAIIDSVHASWRAHLGDPDVCASLPAVLAGAGFEIAHATPMVRTGRPGSAVWCWPEVFFRSFCPVLVEEGRLSPETIDEFWRDWTARSATPHAVFTTPPMTELIAVKQS